MPIHSRLAALVPACAALLAAAPARAQSAPDSGAFVTRIGNDTLAVERYVRTPTQLRGKLVVRSPRTAYREYTAALRPDGSISRMEVAFGPSGGPPAQTAVFDLRADSTIATLHRGDSTTVFRVGTPHTSSPFLSLSYVLWEQALLNARATHRDSVQLDMVALGAPQPIPFTFSRHGGAVTVLSGAGPAHARVDGRGRVVSVDGTGSTQQFLVQRVAGFDVDAFAAASAAHDQQGAALGVLSPRDTVRAEVGGAHLLVDYGRPGKRGRAIFGGVVPWGQVWRTGANAATVFTTDRDLTIGGAAVPAGSYTLWTLPTAEGWKLIVNKQTGQWGTEYDAGKDLVRVDMVRGPVSPAVERFTIAVEPQGAGGVMAFAWDGTRVTVPVAVR
ncbi:MAG: hypothetical protein JWM27_3594 [Gemmatimonadetes bacterium]|nr:hypothetical protein [Gemmatimonadota bacterium]